MTFDRRDLLKLGLLSALAPYVQNASSKPADVSARPQADGADYTIRIATGLVELAPDGIISTTVYNGQFPGPLLRFIEGKPVIIDIHNDTDTPEQLHWHGQSIPADVDGAAEEGTPLFRPRQPPALLHARAERFSLLPFTCAGRIRICRQDSMAGSSARSTSNRNSTPATTTARSSSF